MLLHQVIVGGTWAAIVFAIVTLCVAQWRSFAHARRR